MVCLFVTTVSHAKTAKLIEMLFGIWTQMGLSNYVWNGIQILPREGALLRGMTSGFSRMPPSTVHSGLDVGISPHAIDQHSDWPAAETVECYIKFSQ